MSDWTPAIDDPRVQTRWTGGGYQARWELPVPATRGRCLVCRKDLVVKSDGSLWKHECGSDDPERGYKYVRRNGIVRVFGTLSQAVAVARDKAGFTSRPEQIESPELGAAS